MDIEIENIKKKFVVPSRFEKSDEGIWNKSTALKLKYPCTDLSQGFPNYLINESMVKMLQDVAKSENNVLHQYTRSSGHVRLVNALGVLYSTLLNRKLNALTEIMVTVGAYEALYCAINGNIEIGDEVIVIEPAFDCYEPMVHVAGGIIRHIPLRKVCNSLHKSKETNPLTESSADWKLNENELRNLFNENTKMIVINTPMNPIGKVFTKEELTIIAELCIKYDVICVSDEVYEWMVYEPAKHVKIATLPGMWDRTITIGTAGKSFSVTGWKCGWAYAPSSLINNMRVIHMQNVYSCITPVQEAVARGTEKEIERLNSPDCIFNVSKKELQSKRDYFIQLLMGSGFHPIIPEGGYFIIADWTNLS
ncbi:hypothetical protein PGB90_003517 [Kerria lacca]